MFQGRPTRAQSVDRSGQVQAPDYGAPASRHGFSGELILLSVQHRHILRFNHRVRTSLNSARSITSSVRMNEAPRPRVRCMGPIMGPCARSINAEAAATPLNEHFLKGEKHV